MSMSDYDYGIFYPQTGLLRLLGISEDEMEERTAAGRLFWLDVNRQILYPAFQFHRSIVSPHVIDASEVLLEALGARTPMNQWEAFFWLRAAPRWADGYSCNADVLRDGSGEERQQVMQQAHEVAAQWRRKVSLTST